MIQYPLTGNIKNILNHSKSIVTYQLLNVHFYIVMQYGYETLIELERCSE